MEPVFESLATLWGIAVYVFDGFTHTLSRIVPVLLGVGVLFAGLSYFMPCNGGKPWWSKKGLGTDLLYWFAIPIFTRYVRIGLTVIATYYVLGITNPDVMLKMYDVGHGPLTALPTWVQVILFLVVSDFLLYWMHRAFHGVSLWKYHAVHHSSEDLEWTSAARFHPVNLVLGTVAVDVLFLVGGMNPNVFLFVGPFNTFTSAFVHANLNWTLGPLKYVIAGPVFHRWHHTLANEGGEKNFAGTFSLWDYMFGTFYMPKGALPQTYGTDDTSVPQGFVKQLVYPLLPPPKSVAVQAAE